MFIALLALTHCFDPGPFNVCGRFSDLAPEGQGWAVPQEGARAILTFDAASGAVEKTIALKVGNAQAALKGSFNYANNTLSGKVSLADKNGSFVGSRFDIVDVTESYNGRDKDGKAVIMTRHQTPKEDSPILFGDLLQGDETDPYAVSCSGVTWNPETVKIEVAIQVSGYAFGRSLFNDHAHSNLAFDAKGRLIVGSAQQQAIYRANLDAGTLEVLCSTPDYRAIPSVNPVDGSILYSSGKQFRFLTAGGTETGTLEQNEEVPGMVGWPSYSAYDAKGRLYVMFGHSVSQMSGERPAFVLNDANGYAFQDYTRFAVAKDGTIFVASGSNVFKFAEGGKSPKKILQGPDWKPGRIHGNEAIAFDDRTGMLWVGSNTEDEFIGRVDAFDANGGFLFTLGRGATKAPESNSLWPAQCPFPCSIAVSLDGRLYVANYDQSKAVMEFLPIRSDSVTTN